MRAISFVFCAVLIAAGMTAAHADEASKTAKVEEFFRLSKLDKTFSETMVQASNEIENGVLEPVTTASLTPEEKKQVNQFHDKVAAVVNEGFAWEKVKPAYLKLFADAYTEKELDEIIAFYKSPGGQAMVSKSPVVMTKASEIAKQQMTAILPALRGLVEDFKAQAAKAEAAKPAK